MRRDTYLNVILTVNAILLTVLVWTQLAGGPVLGSAATAHAQSPGDGTGIPNAAGQRQHMIEMLGQMNKNLEATRKMLDSGRIRVQVTNLNEIRLEPAESGD